MRPEGIRRLTLSGLDENALRQLIDHGEDLFVERKRQLPKPPRFGASVGAFANTLGGFLLLGVDDDKNVVGWRQPERTDVQSHLAQVLEQQLDPLAPFVAELREMEGKEIVVVRVFESSIHRISSAGPAPSIYARPRARIRWRSMTT